MITSGASGTVTAEILYPCPGPFDCSLFPARDASAVIALPEGMRLASGSNLIALGEMKPGTSKKAVWKVMAQDGPPAGKQIVVIAHGIVAGNVPEGPLDWRAKILSPYGYSDAIGGEASLIL